VRNRKNATFGLLALDEWPDYRSRIRAFTNVAGVLLSRLLPNMILMYFRFDFTKSVVGGREHPGEHR
jgi:hypothetical protein